MGFCDSSQTQTTRATPIWADPLGPTSVGAGGQANWGTSGAPQIRQGLFNAMQGFSPQMAQSAQDLATRLRASAASPAWQQAQDLAQRTMAGTYLSGSPELNRALAVQTGQAMAANADALARTKAQFTRAGQAFSTGQQQAGQAATAAAAAQAARNNALTYLQNYQTERQAQQAAPGALYTAQAAPLNYLGQIPGALMSPLSQQGQLLTALSGGGNVIMPTQTTGGTSSPSMAANVLGGISAL